MNYKIVLRYGVYSTIFLVVVSLISLGILGTSPDNYDIGAIIGYSTITLSLVFIYFGIRKYKDEHLGGHISFLQSLKVGLLISIFPALAFGLYNLAYVEFIDPDFINKYYEHELSKMEASMSATNYSAAKAQIEEEKKLFMNPGLQFVLMFLNVWIIGLIISIISSIPLTKNKSK